ncbi:MAG: hypothetical protein LBE98_00425 [Puniceicoccales bacterium]|jgi:hypothetical protein|nr:hypothetical protein [Puniceicoccales bacterium]
MGFISSRIKCHVASKAFTLLELMLSLFVVIILIFLGKKLISLAADSNRSTDETRIICKELNDMLTCISDDLKSMVLLDKGQPIFEICKSKGENGFKLLFFTTNSEQHITAAVKYDMVELEFGKLEVSRTILGNAATLSLQKLLVQNHSMGKFFEDLEAEGKHTCKFSMPLADFKIRVAIKIHGRDTISLAPNTKMIYSWNMISYDKNGENAILRGDLSFFDVTLRALGKTDAVKLYVLAAKDKAKAKDFLVSHAESSFARIVPNSVPFP